MPDLLVPKRVPDPFRDHYRALVLGALLRTAETETERHRASGHRLRARRAEQAAARLRLLTTPGSAAAGPVHFGGALRAAVGTAWVAALVLFVVNLVVVGIDSWTTTVTDVALVVLTFAWFWVSSEDLGSVDGARPGRLDLPG